MGRYVGAFVCGMLALTGASLLIEGLSAGDYGWVRNFGAVTLAQRPIAFTAVTLMYCVATLVTGYAAYALATRGRGGRPPRR